MASEGPKAWRGCELGIADVIRHRFSDQEAEVAFNTRVPARSGGTRQVDVAVTWHQPGIAKIFLVVDAKRRGRKLSVKDVEGFIGLVQDVQAELGLLVASEGFTLGARRRADDVRGIELQIVSLDDLPRWKPPGTVEVTVRVETRDAERALDVVPTKVVDTARASCTVWG